MISSDIFSNLLIGVVFVVGVWLLFGRVWPKPRKRNKNNSYTVEGSTGTPLKDTPAGKLGASIVKGVCPDCGLKDGFYKGPEGRISTNIFCAKPKCRAGFNFTPMFGEGHAERIGKGRHELYN